MTRLRDLVTSAVGLILLSPLFGVIAAWVKLDSPGPVIFRQERVGRGGQPFTMHKFRTMRIDAGGLSVTTTSDTRITRAGRLLRASKLDELPQLYDVLIGTMSLVGPRPEVARYVRLWPADLRPAILTVRPGITDPATAILRHEASMLAQAADPERIYVEVLLPVKARAYADYVSSKSFLGDLLILWQTFVAILAPSGETSDQAIQRWVGLVPGTDHVSKTGEN